VQTVDPDSSAGTDSEDDFNPNRSRYAKIEAQNSLILHNGNVLAMSTPRNHRRQTLVPDLGQLPEKAAVPRTVRRLPGGITRGETVPPDLGQLREKAAVPKNVRRLSGGITRGDTVPPDLGQLPEKAAVPRIVRRLPGGITRGEIVSPLVHSARSTAQVNKRNPGLMICRLHERHGQPQQFQDAARIVLVLMRKTLPALHREASL